MQKATLDPSKISGYCGRLKCCLRYEDKTYTELKKRLPRKSALVRTKNGEGKVVDSQILTQLVVVEYDGGARIAEPVDEIEVIPAPQRAEKKQDDAGEDRKAGKDKRARDAKKPREDKKAGRDKKAARNKKQGNRENQKRESKENREQGSKKAQEQ